MKHLLSKLHRNRHFLYCLLCAFISVGIYGQKEIDTVKVVLLVCDMTKPIYVNNYYTFDSLINNGWVGHLENDTTYLDYSHQVWWRHGLEILEKHNTAEGKIDPRGSICIDSRGQIVDCYHDYWVHVKYLDEVGYEFPKGIIIWQSIRRE